ncbi:class F sortase [Lapillicoccus sp.]|uniref:class F sortase n=1 Tax=Lapillicoccus sp. TaxID=1909287 RepID=UPI0025E90825|nr:class F sortase [Lapillicoccus sp.]
MSRSDHDRRRRLARATVVVAAVLAVTGIALLSVALLGQNHSNTSPASAARPNAERNLGPSVSTAPTTPANSTPATTPGSARPSAPPPATVGPVLKRSVPVAITASRIQVTAAPLAQYGLDAQGAIAVPPSTATTPAGWYTGSPTPGQVGPSVIVGHVDSAAAGPSVFYHLSELRPGDRIEVTRADHTVAVFAVDSVETYAKAEFPTLQVYGNINHAGLRLITCGGPFYANKGHYQDNVVAFAHLVSSRPV